MTKSDLIEEIVRTIALPQRESEAIVEAIFDSIAKELHKHNSVEIRGFGSFRPRFRKKRIGRNPKTGVEISIEPKVVVHFKPHGSLKEKVNATSKGSSVAPSVSDRGRHL